MKKVARKLTTQESMPYAHLMRRERAPERATERIEIRWKPSEKAVIQKAADATGLPLTTIIINGALREAARVERRLLRGELEEDA